MRVLSLRDDEGDRGFSPALGEYANYCGFRYICVRMQHRFEIARIDVEAARDDHVLLAIHQDQETVFIEAADVAGADEAPAGRVIPLGLRRFRRLVVIAGHDAFGMADDFAGGTRWQFALLVVDQPDVVPRRWTTDGMQLARVQSGFEHAGAATLRHAVVLDQAARPALQDVGFQIGGERRAGAELGAETREIKAVEVRQRHDARVLHRHQHCRGCAMVPCKFEKAGRIEFRHQHHGAAHRERRQETHQRGVRIQRRRDDRDRIRLIVVGKGALPLPPAHQVRLHDAFRRARRAG